MTGTDVILREEAACLLTIASAMQPSLGRTALVHALARMVSVMTVGF